PPPCRSRSSNTVATSSLQSVMDRQKPPSSLSKIFRPFFMTARTHVAQGGRGRSTTTWGARRAGAGRSAGGGARRGGCVILVVGVIGRGDNLRERPARGAFPPGGAPGGGGDG